MEGIKRNGTDFRCNSPAITIHRVQGLSIDHSFIDKGRTTFAHGQAYVALSRARSIEGVLLGGLVRLLLADPKVSREYVRLNGTT